MKRLIFLALAVSFLLASQPVRANQNFAINQSIRYEVQPNGQTLVSQNISLTNKLADVYATQYSLTLQEVRLADARASDEGGPIQPQVNREGDQTTIKLVFNQPVVGKDKTLNFQLNYKALNLAQKNGQIWEINIPKFSSQNAPESCQVTLVVPTNFGRLALMRPAAQRIEEKDGQKLYFFDGQQIATSGINASFGKFQIFDFILTYHLDNPTNAKISTEIALPPDTAFQQVLYQQIDPAPTNVNVDNDGNWLAQYQLQPHQKINVNALGQAKIFSQPQSGFWTPSASSLKQNLAEQPYWPVSHPLIQAQAKSLTTPRSIYDFVVNHLEYNLGRVRNEPQRLGGLLALQNPDQAICTEFTDLFITLARAKGIPSREINGFAYTTDPQIRPLGIISDILHAWPEYWDQERRAWIPVDPTWGKTTNGVDYFSKTDMNHFAFVIHGENDSLPYPAGSYKATNAPSKDVQVIFGQKLMDADSQLAVHFQLPEAIVIENIGRNALYYLQPQISSTTLDISLINPADKTIIVLPPFAKETISLKLTSLKPFNFQDNLVTVDINGQQFTQTVKIYAFPWQVAVSGLAAISLLLVIFLTRPWNYVRKK